MSEQQRIKLGECYVNKHNRNEVRVFALNPLRVEYTKVIESRHGRSVGVRFTPVADFHHHWELKKQPRIRVKFSQGHPNPVYRGRERWFDTADNRLYYNPTGPERCHCAEEYAAAELYYWDGQKYVNNMGIVAYRAPEREAPVTTGKAFTVPQRHPMAESLVKQALFGAPYGLPSKIAQFATDNGLVLEENTPGVYTLTPLAKYNKAEVNQ